MQNIGNKIKKLLDSCGLSQQEFANMLGISNAAVSHYINNERVPRADLLAKMADLLNVSIEYLLFDNEETNDKEDAYHKICKIINNEGSTLASDKISSLINKLTVVDEKNRKQAKEKSQQRINALVESYYEYNRIPYEDINIDSLCKREGIEIESKEACTNCRIAINELDGHLSIITPANIKNKESRNYEVAKLFVKIVLSPDLSMEETEMAALYLLYPPKSITEKMQKENQSLSDFMKSINDMFKTIQMPTQAFEEYRKTIERMQKTIQPVVDVVKEVRESIDNISILKK